MAEADEADNGKINMALNGYEGYEYKKNPHDGTGSFLMRLAAPFSFCEKNLKRQQ